MRSLTGRSVISADSRREVACLIIRFKAGERGERQRFPMLSSMQGTSSDNTEKNSNEIRLKIIILISKLSVNLN
jgi:hypothetical protein